MPNRKPKSENAASLAQASVFEGFSPDELARVLDLCDEIEVEPGALIVDQGDTGIHCFVIISGRAAVYIAGEYVSSCGPGSVIGEMALLDHRPRRATVLAETEMSLLSFEAPQFRQLLSEMPKAEERIMAMLTARLRANS